MRGTKVTVIHDKYSVSSHGITSPWWWTGAWQRMCVLHWNTNTHIHTHLIMQSTS